MAEMSAKQHFQMVIERLPDDATLDEIAHILEMHRMLAQARAQRAAGKTYTTAQVRERFGLPAEAD